jgi:hypothetical protein
VEAQKTLMRDLYNAGLCRLLHCVLFTSGGAPDFSSRYVHGGGVAYDNPTIVTLRVDCPL